jgi:large subunit ribosomal protein L7/L12
MTNSKIETLKEKAGQLMARARLLEAKEKTKARKEETRRKILAGALALEKAEKSQEEKKKLLAELDGFLTRPLDRKLFGLPETGKVQKLNPEKKTDETPKQTEKRKSA